LQEATQILSDLNLWIGKHPGGTQIAANAVAAAGGLLVLGGALAVLRGVLMFSGVSALAKGVATAAGLAGGAATTGSAAASGAAIATGASTLARVGAAVTAGGSATAFSAASTVLGVLGLLAATNPNRQDPLSHIGGGQAIWEASRRAQADMHQGADMEAHRGAALSALPPPIVNTNVKVGVNVTLDGRQIAALVETHITKENRVVTGASDHDSSAAFAPPDMA
jgi:hypothetical protein